MANGKQQTTLEHEAMNARKSDWYNTARQAKRDVARLGWAQHVLDEEGTHPSTHSAARIRRALNIVAALRGNLECS